MKGLLFLALMCFGLTCISQDTSLNIPKIPDTAKVTFTKVYNDVKSGLTGLASALKVGSEHVYHVLIRQQLVESITKTLLIILFSILTILVIKRFNVNYKRLSDKDDDWYRDDVDDHAGIVIPIVMGICLFIGTTFIIVLNINDIVTGFVNPEYGAIKIIIEFIK